MKALKLVGGLIGIVVIVQLYNLVSETVPVAFSEEREQEINEFKEYQKRAKAGPSLEDPYLITFESKNEEEVTYNAQEFTTDGYNQATYIMGGSKVIRAITVLRDEIPVKTYKFKGYEVYYKAVSPNNRNRVKDQSSWEYFPELHNSEYKQNIIKWFSSTNNCLYGEKFMAKYVKNCSEILTHLGLNN